MGDALKRLDKLTQEEAWMVIAENLRAIKQVERSSSPNFIDMVMESYGSFQKTNCGRASTNGSPHRIRRLTITLRVVLITRKLQYGSSKETFTRNGNLKVLSCGFTASVRLVSILYSIHLDDVLIF
jgi:hypothetical protein